MFYFEMCIGKAMRLKQSFIGLINGLVGSMGYVIYGFSIRNISKEYNYFITAQEYSIYRWSFMFGFVRILNLFFGGVTPLFYSKVTVYTWMLFIVFANVLAVCYNICMKSVWHWQTGIFALFNLLCCVVVMLIF